MELVAQTSTYDSSAVGGAAAIATLVIGLVGALIGLVIVIAINYFIIKKTGYNPWLSLLVLIPGIGGLIILILLLFTEWPIEREVKALRAQLGGGGGYGGPGTYTQPSYAASGYAPGYPEGTAAGAPGPTLPPPGSAPPAPT